MIGPRTEKVGGMVREPTDPEPSEKAVGRESELARIAQIVFSEPSDDASTLVLVGEPGSGKSTLLKAATVEANRRGFDVLSCAGNREELTLEYGALHQLLKPVLHQLPDVPLPQRSALSRAFGVHPSDVQPADGGQDRFLVGLAALNLLLMCARRKPLTVVVDDLQWLDACSLETLLFVARRISDEPVGLLAAVRDDSTGASMWSEFERLTVGPLPDEAAGHLLDTQPVIPRGWVRGQVLRLAEGNPLALVELARSASKIGTSTSEGSIGVAASLLTRLGNTPAERLTALPKATRRMLLIMAVAEAPDTGAAMSAASASEPDGGIEAWSAAEEAELVRLVGGQVRFRHPLMRSVVYGAASFAERREAHLLLAENSAGDPDRRAWHLAAASWAPDESVAGALVETADRARRRGGYWGAAAALERAGQLSEDGWLRARRWLDACELAMRAGEPWWVESLAVKVATTTDDAAMLMEAVQRRGWALSVTGRHEAALSELLPLAMDTVDTAPTTALDAVVRGAVVVYSGGDEVFRRLAVELLSRIPGDAGSLCEHVWARACCDPFGDRRSLMELLDRAATEVDGEPYGIKLLGGAAWVLDETASAVRWLGSALEHLRSVTAMGSDVVLEQLLALAQFDAGAWDAARSSAQNARRVAAENNLETVEWAALYVDATVSALRGDTDRARGAIERAVAGTDVSERRALGVRAAMVRAAVAAVEGDHSMEFELLRELFTAGPDPRPVHYHRSFYGVGDLAAAAVRAGRQSEAAAVVDSVERQLGEGMSPRLRLIVGRARALLCEGEEAEALFRAVVEDPRAEQWPFERAVTAMEFGEWLRRRRRMGDARGELARALTVFERLEARPWVERTVGELRACRAPVRGAEQGPQAAERLTPQQLQIARLAATGLTNRQIGERLFLSARTVGFHLYQVFPKLGISSRGQLRDALDRD
ncbi:ATP-binding protein [Streptomyces sp. NPDC006602]|uniref:ATP-binding protein n=1 Tax=Streptomyces sp. NPDC006602 TaxID=3364751 RepID=UPI0036D0C391